MNHYVDAFLKEVLEEVKYKKMHPQLAQELNDHIESLKEMLMEEEGYTETRAYEEAVKQMGEGVEIGRGLHKMHKPRLEWPTVLLIIGLLGMSLMTLFIYEHYFGVHMESMGYLHKQFVYMALGTVGLIGLYFLDYKVTQKYAGHLYIVGLVLLFLTTLWGYELNGVKRWMVVGSFQIETAVVASPLIMIGYVGLAQKWYEKGKCGLIVLFMLMFLPVTFYIKSHLIQGLAIYGTLLGVFTMHYPNWFKPTSHKTYNIFFWLVTLGISITYSIRQITKVPYRLQYIKMWLNPSMDPMGDGWIMMHLRNMYKGASLIGNKGLVYTLAECDAKQMLPPYGSMGITDYVLNFIIGVMGILPAMILVLIITIFLVRCFKVANQMRESYGHNLLMSMSIWFSIQFILSILSNLALVPITSAYMPFLSYGGSNLVCHMMLMGFFLGIYRRKDIQPAQLISEDIAPVKTPRWMQRVRAFFEIQDDDMDEEDWEDFEEEVSSRVLAEAAFDFLKNCEEVESVKVIFKK